MGALDKSSIDALRMLLHVAQAGSQAMDSWPAGPTCKTETFESDCGLVKVYGMDVNKFENSYRSLKEAMKTISVAIGDLL